MRDEVLLGVERRRRRTEAARPAIPGEVGVNGWTVQDVAPRHDVARQQICQWRREMWRKGLWLAASAPVFLPVEMAGAPVRAATTQPGTLVAEVTAVPRNGRQPCCPEGIDAAALARLARLPETA